MKREIKVEDVVDAGVYIVRKVISEIKRAVRTRPETALESVAIGARKKRALVVDISAEQSFSSLLGIYRDGMFKNVPVYGEESLRDEQLDLSTSKGMVALVDALDGSDLLERGFGNWCSAAVLFDPGKSSGERIVASLVGIPGHESPADVYYATSESAGAFVRRKSATLPVAGPTHVESLDTASICFYGQKAGSFLSVADGSICKNLATMNGLAKDAAKQMNIRIYNFGGIPMLMKLVDHQVHNARGVDAVFEVKGQRPHDCIPGLFIAKKAGVIVRSLDGNEISYSQMEDLLMKPAELVQTYVAASTARLSDELLNTINGQVYVD